MLLKNGLRMSKPGYYINENDGLIIFYPDSSFEAFIQNSWLRVICSVKDLELINIGIDFDYIGEL